MLYVRLCICLLEWKINVLCVYRCCVCVCMKGRMGVLCVYWMLYDCVCV